MERVAGVEPASSVWKTEIMNRYTIPARARTLENGDLLALRQEFVSE